MMEFKLHYKVFNAGRPRTEVVECSCLKGAIDYAIAKYGTSLVRMTYFNPAWWKNVGHWYNKGYRRPESKNAGRE